MKIKFYLVLLLILPALAFPQSEDSRGPQPARIDGAVAHVYRTVGDAELRLHVFSPSDHRESDRRAAIVFFFGGGWMRGSVLQFEPFARHLAARGMVAIVADYRVFDRHGTSPFEAVEDAKAAVGWVRSNADRLGIDPNRIAAGGGSAGGHLALGTAVLPGFEEAGQADPAISKPDALVLFNPAVSTTYPWLSERFRGRGIEASPLHYLGSDLPPTIIFHGKADRLIPYAHVEHFVAAARALGNECALIGYEGAAHGFFNAQRHEGKWFRETLLETDRFLTSLGYLPASPSAPAVQEDAGLAHGPMLGNISAHSVRVWARTERPGSFRVRYSVNEDLSEAATSDPVTTTWERDATGWIELSGLKPDTKYFYAVEIAGRITDTRVAGRFNSFRTLPDPDDYRHPEYNPDGLFNFSFEIGSCNWQYINTARPVHEDVYGTPLDVVYRTMMERLKGRINFHIVNGDWIYEEAAPPAGHSGAGLPGIFRGLTGREVTADQWASANAVGDARPEIVDLADGITGVWQNYKTYLERGVHMANFHREVPLFVMFDDHEIYNDVLGAGHVGLRTDSRGPGQPGNPFDVENVAFWQEPERRVSGYHGFRPFRQDHEGEVERSVFRDPALQAWEDYLGWANPDVGLRQPLRFGRARLQESSDLLHDPSADFSSLSLEKSGTLHVHWGQGNSGVYEIEEIVDRTRLRIRPAPTVTEEARYSIGTNHYTKFRVSNSDFFLLDARGARTLHNPADPHDPNSSMLGRRQLEWLMDEMKQSDADFFFLVSSVSFMIPHDNGAWRTGGGKDESWTVYAAERDRLLDFFEELDKPVFLLTGDIHNSASVRISEKVWEFLSGPHMSNNHRISDMGNMPLSGPYLSQGRPVTVRWATGRLDDTPQEKNSMYCVVKVNNAFSSPDAERNPRWVAHQVPQVIFQFYDGTSGELLYAESVTAR